MKKKRILLLSEGFGTGHTQAAHALSASLRRLSSDVQPRVIELGAFLHPTITPWVLSAYRKTVSSRPKLIGFIYKTQYNRSLNKFTQLALHRLYYTEAAEIIRQLRPDGIVCTHPFPSIVVSRLKRLGLDVPLFTVITDYDAHGAWVSSEVNRYFVSTPEVRRILAGHGVPDHKIEVTGIPVHPNFWEKRNKDEARAKFMLQKMPTVLIMGGGWGLFRNESLLRHIVKWKDRLQLIFCMGDNRKALNKLLHDKEFSHPNVRLLGFTREIDELMEVSDLLITKPGGMTCTEGMAKGIPMLFYNPIPGQEQQNCKYFIERGYGEELKSLDTIDQWFRLLVERYPEVEKRRLALTREMSRYNPQRCSRAILESLGVHVT